MHQDRSNLRSSAIMKRATSEAPTPYGAVSAVRSFPPIENRAARVLVLGSMPGAASLLAGRYYAYPRNAFWPIMGELFGAGPTISYEKRVLILRRAGLALWDVMASCIREGSLDADIDEASIIPNDFRAFFATHSRVRYVFFNGAKAENCFRRTVRPHFSDCGLHLPACRRPAPRMRRCRCRKNSKPGGPSPMHWQKNSGNRKVSTPARSLVR